MDEITVNGQQVAQYIYDTLSRLKTLAFGNGALQEFGYNTDTGWLETLILGGGEAEGQTGNYYYRHRYYHSKQGRFMSNDPIGYGDGLNMYAYAGNDPVNRWDPMGLDTEEIKTTADRLDDDNCTGLCLIGKGCVPGDGQDDNGGSGGGSGGGGSSQGEVEEIVVQARRRESSPGGRAGLENYFNRAIGDGSNLDISANIQLTQGQIKDFVSTLVDATLQSAGKSSIYGGMSGSDYQGIPWGTKVFLDVAWVGNDSIEMEGVNLLGGGKGFNAPDHWGGATRGSRDRTIGAVAVATTNDRDSLDDIYRGIRKSNPMGGAELFVFSQDLSYVIHNAQCPKPEVRNE